jgi:endonuclease/exonuclease/phosphatase family metal-dependent hydrolase
MRIATYNLLHGIPVLGRPDQAPLGEEVMNGEFSDDRPLRESIRRLAADVVGLQEVDRHQPRSGGHDQVEVVADVMNTVHARFAPSVSGTPGSAVTMSRAHDGHDHAAANGHDDGPMYGVGLVSRWPVRAWHSTRFDPAPFGLPLLVPDRPRPRLMNIPDEPRAALAAEIDSPFGLITVATVHLSFVPGYNVKQLRALMRWLAPLPRPLFLVGDFNLPGGLPRLVSRWEQLARVATYPTPGPRVQFDHVFGDGLPGGLAQSARAQAIALPVSDHCALAVDLTWPPSTLG